MGQNFHKEPETEENDDYEYDYEYDDEDYEEDETSQLSPLGIDPPVSVTKCFTVQSKLGFVQ